MDSRLLIATLFQIIIAAVVTCVVGCDRELDSQSSLLKILVTEWNTAQSKLQAGYEFKLKSMGGPAKLLDDGISSVEFEELWEVKVQGLSQKSESIGDGVYSVYGINKDYRFFVEQRHRDGNWAVIQTIQHSDLEGNAILNRIYFPGSGWFSGLRLIEGVFLGELFLSEDFRVINTESYLDSDYGNLLRIEFISKYIDSNETITSGSVILMSDFNSIIKKFEIEIESDSPGKVLGEILYQYFNGDLLPRKLTTTYVFGNEINRYNTEIFDVRRLDGKLDIPRLSDFGLPEPPIKNNSSVSVIFPVLLFVIGLIVLFFFMKIWNRK